MTTPAREQITRAEDPDHLADTEVDPPLGWGDDHTAFIASLAREQRTRVGARRPANHARSSSMTTDPFPDFAWGCDV